MSGGILITWGLVLEVDADVATSSPSTSSGDARSLITIESVFARAQRAYLDRCSVLAEFLDSEGAEVGVSAGSDAMPQAGVLEAGRALVGVSVVEVRPTSFDMAVRIRPTGVGEGTGDGDGEDLEPLDIRRTLVVERTATTERLTIPHDVRGEFIALQLAARDYC